MKIILPGNSDNRAAGYITNHSRNFRTLAT